MITFAAEHRLLPLEAQSMDLKTVSDCVKKIADIFSSIIDSVKNLSSSMKDLVNRVKVSIELNKIQKEVHKQFTIRFNFIDYKTATETIAGAYFLGYYPFYVTEQEDKAAEAELQNLKIRAESLVNKLSTPPVTFTRLMKIVADSTTKLGNAQQFYQQHVEYLVREKQERIRQNSQPISDTDRNGHIEQIKNVLKHLRPPSPPSYEQDAEYSNLIDVLSPKSDTDPVREYPISPYQIYREKLTEYHHLIEGLNSALDKLEKGEKFTVGDSKRLDLSELDRKTRSGVYFF
jgi:hypothetical protein